MLFGSGADDAAVFDVDDKMVSGRVVVAVGLKEVFE